MKTNFFSLTVLKLLLTPLLVILLLPVCLQAQTIDIPTGNNPLFEFPAFQVGTPVNPPVAIGLSPSTSSQVLWSFANLPANRSEEELENGELVGFTVSGVHIKLPTGATTGTSGDATATISGTPNESAGAIEFRINVITDNGSGSAAGRTYRVSINRDPVDLAVILDRSGSMGSDIAGNFPPAAGKKTRWDFLQSGIAVMANQLQASAKPGDRLGVRMFASFPNVIPPQAPYNAPDLISLPEVIAGLPNALAQETPSGGTALGDGVLAGRDLLVADDLPHTKAMIVFSDGEQNSGDLVDAANPVQTVSGQLLRGGKPLQIHTICLGSTTANKALMNDIAAQNGGTALLLESEDEADEQAFQLAFIEQLKNIFGVQSGARIAGSFAAGTGQAAPQSFDVNKGIDALVVTLVAPAQHGAFFKTITRNGVDMKDAVNIVNGPGFISFSIKPGVTATAAQATQVAVDGKWTIVPALGTPDTAAVPFTMIVAIDDRNVKPVFSLGAQEFKVNDLLRPNVKLTVQGKPVKNAKVTVTIIQPGDDVNDLVAKSNVKAITRDDADFVVQAGDTVSAVAAKMALLLKDKSFRNKIRRKEQTIRLLFNPFDNTYKGVYNGLKVTGAYQAIFNITATHPQLGKIQRQHQESFFVHFPEIDRQASKPKAGKDLLGNVVLTFIPRATNGKFIGSGWKDAIKLEGSDIAVKKITDTGIGIYFITLSQQPEQPFRLSLAGQLVFEGTLADLGFK
ncbi:vWA domain-containing protein [Chitinophaga japonensis]|uniref:Mg-chelatase subunit ChlD n=1 Tax=Chitinophaga japonensis TaxID=104662 RepID=A0A562T1I0_CHIJA|nr:vWA domain-containing protein [Chitinophaga japonensis]TWI87028.1 Mg-chelatase subunit ChlD [Chitinophaga japonensis]